MRPLLIALVLVLVVIPAEADMLWHIDYLVRGDISQVAHFYGPGTYELLLGPDYVPVYLKAENWNFIGMYGEPALGYPAAVLPVDFPSIVFPGGIDQIVVSPVASTPTAAVPEPAAILLLAVGLVGLVGGRIFGRVSAPGRPSAGVE